MTTYQWRILETYSDGTYINSVKYQLTATDGDFSVQTEGNYDFPKEDAHLLKDDLLEVTVADWVDRLSDGVVKSNLDNQLKQLKSQKKAISPPWHIETFKFEI